MNTKDVTISAVFCAVSLNCAVTAQVATVPEQLQNEHIIQDHSTRKRLESLQRIKPKSEISANEKLKKSIVDYNKPNKDLESIKFQLKHINYTPKSQHISSERLNEIGAKYLNKDISFNDIQRLRVDLINEYQLLGYTLSTVNIPAQKLTNKSLTIELIESKIKEVSFSGNSYLPNKYFDSYVGHYRDRYFNAENLESDLERFNSTSKANMVAKSKASDTYGYSDLVFHIQEPKRWNISVSTDNYGTERTGEERFLSSVSVYDVTNGVDDSVVIGTTQSEGNNSWYGVYERPVNRLGTRASLTLSSGRTEVSAGPDDSLDIDGSSESITFQVTHPIYTSNRASLKATLGYRYSNSDSFFVGNFLDDTRINTGYATLLGSLRDQSGAWSGDITLSSGRSKRFDDPGQGFTTISLSAVRQQQLGKHWTASVQLSGQYSDNTRLPSAASFFIGGQSTVRGFDEGSALGAHGVNVKVDLSTRPFSFLDLKPSNTLNNLRLTFFTDHGSVYTDIGGGVGLESNSFNSYGLALNYQPLPGLSISTAYANPFDIDHDLENERNWTFSVNYNYAF